MSRFALELLASAVQSQSVLKVGRGLGSLPTENYCFMSRAYVLSH